jgi:DNA-binding response OmpR family regulator
VAFSMNKLRILFVEDDPDMNLIYADSFQRPEFEVAFASDGIDAINMLRNRSEKFDVVVTDNFMPRMDGIAMLRNIRKEFPQQKVIMITGCHSWWDNLELQNLGISGLFNKPVRMRFLKSEIRKLCPVMRRRTPVPLKNNPA